MKNIKTAVQKPREVALYAHMSSDDWYTVFEVTYSNRDEHYTPLQTGQRRELPMEGYVRVSAPLEVKFTAIDEDMVIQKAVESLNAEERKAIEDLNAKIASIRERKNQLLALGHQPVGIVTSGLVSK